MSVAALGLWPRPSCHESSVGSEQLEGLHRKGGYRHLASHSASVCPEAGTAVTKSCLLPPGAPEVVSGVCAHDKHYRTGWTPCPTLLCPGRVPSPSLPTAGHPDSATRGQ